MDEVTDGVVVLRAPEPGDAAVLIAERDEEFHRFLGQGSDDPAPTACIVVGDEVVGWVDYDHDPGHDWLDDDEVNLGYSVAADHRRKGYASRAVTLLLRVIAETSEYTTASLLIDPDNVASLGLAEACGFERQRDVRDQCYFTRDV